mmetsp:Transcript_150894/g.262843  ORF Transcript_150894/g.262843 Transcript_150894/m.262843 type:complete len:274 (-) Transcript_150894:223-1044(-)
MLYQRLLWCRPVMKNHCGMSLLHDFIPDQCRIPAAGGEKLLLHCGQIQPFAADLCKAIGPTTVFKRAVCPSPCKVARAKMSDWCTLVTNVQVNKRAIVLGRVGVAYAAHGGPSHEELANFAVGHLFLTACHSLSTAIRVWWPQRESCTRHRSEASPYATVIGCVCKAGPVISDQDEPILTGDQEIQQRRVWSPAHRCTCGQGLAPGEDHAHAGTLLRLQGLQHRRHYPNGGDTATLNCSRHLSWSRARVSHDKATARSPRKVKNAQRSGTPVG